MFGGLKIQEKQQGDPRFHCRGLILPEAAKSKDRMRVVSACMHGERQRAWLLRKCARIATEFSTLWCIHGCARRIVDPVEKKAAVPLPARHGRILGGCGGLQRQLQILPELEYISSAAGADPRRISSSSAHR